MNEQLVVKNFGPIKDATVDFKRVTVFIGPTGGGKSTLAKLLAILKKGQTDPDGIFDADFSFKDVSISSYIQPTTKIDWTNSKGAGISLGNPETMDFDNVLDSENTDDIIATADLNKLITDKAALDVGQIKSDVLQKLKGQGIDNIEDTRLQEIIRLATEEFEKRLVDAFYKKNLFPTEAHYIPSERTFIAAIGYSWAGLLRDDIGLPKPVLDFANGFSTSRKTISELEIPFLNVRYVHHNGQDYIKVPGVEALFRLYETASGIQSVIPLLVLLENLSRNLEQIQSFIIEEPELNLYPTAQQGLLNWLVEKCTKGENDLTITTHSPYLLAHLNLLLYAYQVAENHPERADDVAKIVPRESWINPKEFAAYHVEGQVENGVRSIVNPETGLISYNGLDSIASAETSEFEKLLDINAGLEV